ncbi:cytochrome P450 9e2-like [Aphidius gifuensis]|uniref:cytochrome P450 9e2-like n=1 Tax=Aphidius gifuensis TaxID=684658 RepID=UPI001CDD67B6|nr:cytochrome P450 9e2-like [Aphidius gifuensis]
MIDSLTIVSIIVTSLATIIYFFYVYHNKYFEKLGIPYRKSRSIWWLTLTAWFQRIAITDYLDSVYSVHSEAKYVGFFDFGVQTVMIRDTELIKSITVKNFEQFVNHRVFIDPKYEPLFGNILLTLQDDKWRHIRTLLTPTFTSSKMKAMFKLMMNCAVNFVDHLTGEQQKKGEPLIINSKDEFCRYANDAITACAFSISVDSMKNPNNDFYLHGKTTISFGWFRLFKFFMIKDWQSLAKLLRFKVLKPVVNKFFINVVKDTIRMRDETGISRPDMIQLMMDTRKSDNLKLSIEDMTSQALVFFFGGFDSPTTAISFAAHEIAANPEVQTRLQAEIDGLIEECKDEGVTYEALNSLKYLDAVINESLRMWPVVPLLERVCSEDFVLPPTLPGKQPYTIKPGDSVWIPIYSIQRDPKHFDQPDKFNPDRFFNRSMTAFNAPFGLGPRMCIAYRFAIIQMKVVLMQLISKCQLSLPERMALPIKMPKNGFSMVPADRNSMSGSRSSSRNGSTSPTNNFDRRSSNLQSDEQQLSFRLQEAVENEDQLFGCKYDLLGKQYFLY